MCETKNLLLIALFITGISSFCYSGELPDTGQTTSYTETYGEDHDYQPAASSMSYTDNGNGTITDNRTGLMWLQEGNYAFNGQTSTGTWEQALGYCENFTYAGYSDWRLPNVRELDSIVKFEGAAPFINTTYFLNTVSGVYWTSTTYVPITTRAMYVGFDSGCVYYDNKTGAYCVRPVRGGP
ncbi:MAG: adhesin [Elusimicrobia bacterium HGW-Elusimicrobia-2]|nr:MAG: adhesin [Elusimicrobia bacterium HGW-Elusimicrobia-2]